MDASLIISILALLVAIASLAGFLSFSKKFKGLVKDRAGGSLENTLQSLLDKLELNEKELSSVREVLNNHEQRILGTISRVATMRYNPFQDTGGDLSFAISFLDEKNNGLVLSSIHGRGGTRVYAKPIVGGKSQYNLSDEEQKVINTAISNGGTSVQNKKTK